MANKTQKDILANLFFTAEGGGAEVAISGEKKVIAPEVRLYFLRYGLFSFDSNTEDEDLVNGNSSSSAIYRDENSKEENINSENEKHAVFIKEGKSQNLFLKEGEAGKGSENELEGEEDFNATLPEIQVLTVNSMPDLENFYVARTAVNPGYIYIMNDEDPDEYYELEINTVGELRHISWEYEKNRDANNEILDVRIPEKGEDLTNFKIIHANDDGSAKKVCVAYSPVQWSREYHYQLNTDRDKRLSRMKLIDCSGIQKEAEPDYENALAYNQVSALFHKHHAAATALQKTLHQIHVDEGKQDKIEQENPDEKNIFYEDMFITLDDPMGCAHDVNNATSEKILSHKALVEAIHSGESHKDAFDRLLREEYTAPTPDPNYQSMFSLALTTYHFIYNNNESSINYDGGKEGLDIGQVHPEDDTVVLRATGGYDSATIGLWGDNYYESPNIQIGLGHGASHDKLIGILGKQARENSRAIAMSYRNDLGVFLDSSYMKLDGYLDDYLGNTTGRLLDGRSDCLELLNNLIVNPIVFEKTLILKRHQQTDEDAWTKWVYKKTNEDNLDKYRGVGITSNVSGYEGINPFFAVMSVGINVTELGHKKLKTGYKILRVLKAKLKYLSSQIIIESTTVPDGFEKIPYNGKQNFLLSRMTKNIFFNKKVLLEFRDGDIVPKDIPGVFDLELDVLENDKHFTPRSQQHSKNLKNAGLSAKERLRRLLKTEVEIIKSSRGDHSINIATKGHTLEQKYKPVDVESNKYGRVEKFTTSRGYTGFFAMLEYVNFVNAIADYSENNSVKNMTNVGGSVVKTAEATTSLIDAFRKHLINEGGSSFSQTTKVLGAVGSVFTAGMCYWDAIEIFNKRDPDSGWAMVGAGAAFTVAAGVSITAAAITSSGAIAGSIATYGALLGLVGPVGWVAALVGVGFLLLSQMLKDTRLQTYFKYYLLSDYKTTGCFIKPNESPMAYNRRLYGYRHYMTNKDAPTPKLYADPSIATTLFLDLVTCSHMNLKVDDYITEKLWESAEYGVSYKVIAKQITGTFTYNKFFNNKDQVETKIFFLPNGFSGVKEELKDLKTKVKIVKDVNGNDAVEVSFKLDRVIRSQIKPSSLLLFTTRLAMDECGEAYFPHSINNDQRWLGAKVDVYKESRFASNFNEEEIEFVAGKMEDLKKKVTWKK